MLKIALVTVGDPDQVTGGYLYHKRMAQMANRHDASVSTISIPHRILPLQVAAGFAINHHVLAVGADVTVIDSIAAAALGPYLTLKSRSGLIASIHQPPGGVGGSYVTRWLSSGLDRTTYRRCERLIVASELLRESFIREGWSEGMLVVVPPGNDLHARPDAEPEDLRCGRRLAALSVANWLPEKGILETLMAVTAVPEDTCTLHLVGDAGRHQKYASNVSNFIREHAMQGRVIVHGIVSPGRLASLYRDADILISTSHVEAFATAVAEAMHFGLPVLGWRIGNVARLVTERAGVLLEAGDVVGLTTTLTFLAREPELLFDMSASAVRAAAAWPSWDESGKLFFETLRA